MSTGKVGGVVKRVWISGKQFVWAGPGGVIRRKVRARYAVPLTMSQQMLLEEIIAEVKRLREEGHPLAR